MDRYKKGFVEEPPAGYCAGGPEPWKENGSHKCIVKMKVRVNVAINMKWSLSFKPNLIVLEEHS